MTWTIAVNDERGIHTPAYQATRQAAERFAAARSRFRPGAILLVIRTVGPGGWVSAYKGGRLHDTQDGRSWVPDEQRAEREELRRRYAKKGTTT